MVQQPVAMKEIAKELGLSRTTVSYVLNGKHAEVKIAPDTAKRVLNAADLGVGGLQLLGQAQEAYHGKA